jgi:NAD(P)-dependent dehydrogenase (short-subunit alcohol dehydrogenase family)
LSGPKRNAKGEATASGGETRTGYQREQPSISFEAYLATIGKGIPIGRMGTAQEYANLACFLASEAGSSVTGTAINLDGGACPVV